MLSESLDLLSPSSGMHCQMKLQLPRTPQPRVQKRRFVPNWGIRGLRLASLLAIDDQVIDKHTCPGAGSHRHHPEDKQMHQTILDVPRTFLGFCVPFQRRFFACQRRFEPPLPQAVQGYGQLLPVPQARHPLLPPPPLHLPVDRGQ